MDKMNTFDNTPLKNAEMTLEDDYDSIDGIINNGSKKDAEEKTYYDEIYKRMKKYIGNVWISDLKYSDDIMINMIELAEKNNFIDGLPKVLINYYKRMKNKNYKK